MILGTGIALFILRLLNVLLHTSGLYLLVEQYRKGENSVQQIFLLQLSLTEVIKNFLTVFMVPIRDMATLQEHVDLAIDTFQEYLVIFIEILVWMVYYLTMVTLTLDKLFTIWLHIKYPLYWNQKKTKIMFLCMWIFFTILAIVVLCGNIYKLFDYYPYVWYIYVTFDFAFVLIAILVYGFIFRKFTQTRTTPTTQRRVSNMEAPTLFQVFRKSRFYISVLLIATFLCFKVTGDMLFFFYHIIYDIEESNTVDMSVYILWAVSDMVDAWIYIFAQSSVRGMLVRKLRVIGGCFATCHTAGEGNSERAVSTIS